MSYFLVWDVGTPETPKLRRAEYATLEDAKRQALGDERPGRVKPCPTCGHHVNGGPSGLGDIDRGINVLRVEDAKGKTVWTP